MTPIFTTNETLIPAIIQHAESGQILMLGYMNRVAYEQTISEGIVTFFSRSRQQLWTKGATSGHFLELVSMDTDCDQDALLVRVLPKGPTCHTGSWSCFGEEPAPGFLYQLQKRIDDRINAAEPDSYTASLLQKGKAKIAQKVGEEAVEVVIDAVAGNRERLIEETADLMYHLTVLLRASDIKWEEVAGCLRRREK